MVRSAIRPLLRGPARDAAIAEQPGRRSATGDGSNLAALGAVVPQPEHAPHGQVGQADAAGPGGVRVHRVQVARAGGRGRTGPLAARLGVQRRVGQPEQLLGLLPGLVPDRRPAHRIRYVPADQRRRGRMAGQVGRLRGGRDQRLQEAVVPQADHVDQVAGLEPREPDLDPARRLGGDDHDLAPLGRALVDQQRGRSFALDDRARHPADLGPDPVDDRPARMLAPDNCVIALPERRRRNLAAAPGLRARGQREALLAQLGPQHENVRADVQDPAGDRVDQDVPRDLDIFPRRGERMPRLVAPPQHRCLKQRSACESSRTGRVRDIVAPTGNVSQMPHLPSVGLHAPRV